MTIRCRYTWRTSDSCYCDRRFESEFIVIVSSNYSDKVRNREPCGGSAGGYLGDHKVEHVLYVLASTDVCGVADGDTDNGIIEHLGVSSSVANGNTLSESEGRDTHCPDSAVIQTHLHIYVVSRKKTVALDLERTADGAGRYEPHDGLGRLLVLNDNGPVELGGVHIDHGKEGDGRLGSKVHAHDAVSDSADGVADAADNLLGRGWKSGDFAGVEVEIVEVVPGCDGAVVAVVPLPDRNRDGVGTKKLVDLGVGALDLPGLVVGVHNGLASKAHLDEAETAGLVASEHHTPDDVLAKEEGLLVLLKFDEKLAH